MIDPATIALALGTGILGHLGKRASANEARRMAAIQAKYSPWTGFTQDLSRAEKPALMEDILKGVGTGLAMSQADKKAAADEKFRQDWLKTLKGNKEGNVWGAMAQPTMPINKPHFKGGYDDPALAGIEDEIGAGQGGNEYSLGGGWNKAQLINTLLGRGQGGRVPV